MAFLVILFCFGLAGGVVGRIKGSSFFIWFLISFCVPFIGLACALLYRWDNNELRRECPGCGKVVKLHDALCTRCGTELDFPDTAIASEAQIAAVRRERSAAAHAHAEQR
jgi:predicted amidophosphoribosyltransferase